MLLHANFVRIMAAFTVLGAWGIAPTAFAAVTQTDDVLILADGFSLGGEGWDSGEPAGPATLTWTQGWWGAISSLSGVIHFDGVASSCARVRVISYDGTGAEISTNFSDEECAFDDGHSGHNFEVDGAAGAAEVKISLQSLALNGAWGSIGSKTVSYGPELGTSVIRITGNEIDVGTGPFNGGAPDGYASVNWTVSSDEVTNGITPEFSGTLYMNNADDRCARVRVEYKSAVLGLLDTRRTTERCVTNDQLHTFPLSAISFVSAAVDEVTYTIETRPNGGAWADRGSASAFLH